MKNIIITRLACLGASQGLGGIRQGSENFDIDPPRGCPVRCGGVHRNG